MPNHISNRLTFECSPEESAKVLAEIKGEREFIDFNTLIPYPAQWAKADSEAEAWRKANQGKSWSDCPKDGYNHGGYEWCIANWGTKWNAYDQHKAGDTVILFDTAWSTAEPIFDTLAAKYPAIPFKVEYADEDIGSNAGVLIYRDGEKQSEALGHAEAAALWFNLNDADPAENGYDPVTFEYKGEEAA